MKAIIKIYNSAMAWFGGIARDKLLHLLAGVLIAAFFALVIPHTAGWCIVFAVFAGLAKESIDQRRYNGWDWSDLTYTVFGGLIIQIFAWL
ncbi:hypothetical protein [uncultured Alistipes sp.]|uniref:hypothetical protein n=1 Tax=uncultured Alistipes sp. TaxID=538949 RepID=UPI0026771C4D|nr:hypothetical protein [uncultured Alistipes sp.]